MHTAYKRKIAAACALMMLFYGGLVTNGFAVYQPFIISENGFTNAQASLILTVRNLASFLAMLLAGVCYRKLGLKRGIILSGLCGGAGLILFALAGDSLPVNCLAGLLLGVPFGIGATIPMSILVERTFTEEKKRVLGLCAAMTGLSTLGIPSGITAVIERFGLKTAFMGEGILFLSVTVVVFWLLRELPAYAESAEAAPEGPSADTGLRPLTKKQAPLMGAVAVLCGAVGFVGCTNLSVLCTTEGISPQGAALAVSVFGITLTVSKALYGFVSEKLGTVRCNWLYGGILIAGLLLTTRIQRGTLWMLLSMAVYAIGLATATVGLTVWAGELAPAGQHSRLARLFQLGYMGGGLLFAYMPGVMADAFGSYVPAYLVLAGFALLFTLGIGYIYQRAREK